MDDKALGKIFQEISESANSHLTVHRWYDTIFGENLAEKIWCFISIFWQANLLARAYCLMDFYACIFTD
jgi:hypothetical protein